MSVQCRVSQGVALDCLVWAFQAPKANKALRPIGWFLLKCLLIACVLASILFAHGCHGKEDHELFGAAIHWLEK
jgi:hypothetical protein